MATFHFDLVSPEKLAFSGDVDQVDVPGIEGDFGVLAGHAPVVATIRPGILTVTTGGTQQKIIVLGGLAEVSEKGLTVLADVATSLEELDRAGSPTRSPAWKPSSPKKTARNSTAPSSGSIITRASSTRSIRPRCISEKRVVQRLAALARLAIRHPRISRSCAPPSDTPRGGTAPPGRRRDPAVPNAIDRTPPAGRCAASADRSHPRDPVKRSANHFWRWPRNLASRCDGSGEGRKLVAQPVGLAEIVGALLTPVSSQSSRITASRGFSSPSMPPCGICHSRPGRMISGPSSLNRRPINTRPRR